MEQRSQWANKKVSRWKSILLLARAIGVLVQECWTVELVEVAAEEARIALADKWRRLVILYMGMGCRYRTRSEVWQSSRSKSTSLILESQGEGDVGISVLIDGGGW